MTLKHDTLMFGRMISSEKLAERCALIGQSPTDGIGKNIGPIVNVVSHGCPVSDRLKWLDNIISIHVTIYLPVCKAIDYSPVRESYCVAQPLGSYLLVRII